LRRVEAQSAEGPRRLGDAELLRLFAEQRDEAAFAVLVARHGPLVWAVCRNLLPDETDAEDAFQATFLALVKSAATIRTTAVGAWLHGVAVRVARMAKRSAGRRRQRERKVAVKESAEPIAQATWDQLQAAVHEEVGRLPESLRVAFVLCNLQGRSQPEVAANQLVQFSTVTPGITHMSASLDAAKFLGKALVLPTFILRQYHRRNGFDPCQPARDRFRVVAPFGFVDAHSFARRHRLDEQFAAFRPIHGFDWDDVPVHPAGFDDIHFGTSVRTIVNE